MNNLHHFYTQRKDEFSQQSNVLKRKARLVSSARIIVALVFVALIYLSFDSTLFLYAILPVVLLFVYLVSTYSKVQDRLVYLSSLIEINDWEINSLGHDYSQYEDGSTYVDSDHNYSYDLDLFGKGSLFQYLNRCGTKIGEDNMAKMLLAPAANAEEIKARQEAISELAKNVELRQAFWAHGKPNKTQGQDNRDFKEWLQGEDHILGQTKYLISLILFPIIGLSVVGLVIYNFDFLPLLFVSTGVQLTITSFHSKMVSGYEQTLTRYQKVFRKYSQLLNELDQVSFESPLLSAAKENARLASQQIVRFSKLVNALESRNNAIAYGFGNGLYLYDLQYICRLEKWRSDNKSLVNGWIEKIAEVDALISFGTFSFNHPENSFPEIHSKLEIEAVEVGHPLISKSERVDNSFDLGISEKIMLITGANMAGKSTFLRTVGVNLILALSGSSVCAKKFSCPIIGLATSMRATDSLVEHQSYFYAELNRLKEVMDRARSGEPFLILLDEILRGTNSNDKHDGSVGLVKQFVSGNALVMLASHDVALGELANEFPGAIRNFCFESDIREDVLSFDYTLHEGVAHKANATFLMKKMGILPGGD